MAAGASGTQQCITVPSLRSVMVDRSPSLTKVDLWYQFIASEKLKHLVIFPERSRAEFLKMETAGQVCVNELTGNDQLVEH